MCAAQKAPFIHGNQSQPVGRNQSQPPAASTRLFVPTQRWIPFALHRVAPYEYPRCGRMSPYTQETCVRGPRSACARGSWTKCRVKPCRPGARNPVPNFPGRSCAHKFSLKQKFRVGNRKKQAFPKLNDIAYLVCSIPAASFKHRICGVCHARPQSDPWIGANHIRTKS